MKYVVKAAGLYHGADYFAYGEAFPASLKGFDYKDALERKLIEESSDGVISFRPDAEVHSNGLQGQVASGNTDKKNSD